MDIRSYLLKSLVLLLFLPSSMMVSAQEIDLLLKGGHLIDPKNKIDGLMDVGISNGKISKVAANIPAGSAKKVVNVKGLFVTPGLLDIHVHVFAGTNAKQGYMDGPFGVQTDAFSFRAGVTTVVDAGSSGWRSFPLFKKNIIEGSKTRVLAFLNIVGDGMGEHQQDSLDMDPKLAAKMAMDNKNDIVGFKVAHYSGLQWIPVDSAVAAGKLASMPVMIDFRGLGPNSIEALFATHLRPGDIFTHVFHGGRGVGSEAALYKEAIVDDNGIVKPFVFTAQKKGIIFDVGHGGNGFLFSQVVPALKQGFKPNSISSDLHDGSMNAGMKDMANILSKFLNLGMPLNDIILRSTWNPAQEINRPDLGQLSVGADADIAVFSVHSGNFGFIDSHGRKLTGNKKLDAELTIRAGKVEWDLNGISVPEWNVKPLIY